MLNKYTKDSELFVETQVRNNRTFIRDSFFTSPFKIISPFYEDEHNMMKLCIMNVSPGMLEGDIYKQAFILKEGSRLHIFSQSYGKVFSMKEGHAEQIVKVTMKGKSNLEYYPLPVIPYRESSYKGISEFYMEGDSHLVYREILSCGRSKMGESFMFKTFSSLVKIYYDNRLLVWDNTVLTPSDQPLKGIGFYEGFSHAANVFIVGSRATEEVRTKIHELLRSYPGISYGISKSSDKSIIIRILGYSSDYLCRVSDEIRIDLNKYC